MTITPLADLVGANSAVPLASAGIARQVMLTIATGTGSVRIGDSTVSSSKGASVPTTGLILTFSPFLGETYSLNQIYAYIPTGTTLSVSSIN